jgi:hypothetical protein
MFMGWKDRHFDAAQTAEDVAHDDQFGTSYANSSGILSGTMIATPSGWRGVEAVAVGDEVMTFDGGAQQVVGVSRALLWNPIEVCPEARWPLHVPAGLIGNRRAMMLQPDEIIMIESDLAEALFGDPFALIPASALDALDGVTRQKPEGYLEVVTLTFASDQLVFAEGAAMVMCEAHADTETVSLEDLLLGASQSDYDIRTLSEATQIVAALAIEPQTSQLAAVA